MNMDKKQLICVDNWSDTTLKRMQQFFFHSKHCDLTLRFNNNTALTVHRLILRMYTDYFDRLITRNNISDRFVMMPRTLQADVTLPIIKFFYTGSIEFDDHRLCALLEAAKLIRVPILVELLELHQKRTRAKIVTTFTTLTEKKPTIIHSLFANRDITVNVLGSCVMDMPVVKKIKVCERTSKRDLNGSTNISNDNSHMSDLISSAIRNVDAIDGPLRFSPQTKSSNTSGGSPFGQISYVNMIDNINERASGDAPNVVQTNTPKKKITVAPTPSEFLTPSKTSNRNRTPKKSFKEYIDFPIHHFSNDQFFTSDNINSADFSTDANADNNLSYIELSSDSELFEVIELDY